MVSPAEIPHPEMRSHSVALACAMVSPVLSPRFLNAAHSVCQASHKVSPACSPLVSVIAPTVFAVASLKHLYSIAWFNYAY